MIENKFVGKIICLATFVNVLLNSVSVAGFLVSPSSSIQDVHCISNKLQYNKNAPFRIENMISKMTSLHSKKNNINNEEDDDGDDDLVTKEMFLRNMLDGNENDNLEEYSDDNKTDQNNEEPLQQGKTKRKKRNGSHYRVLDNRDNLPFLVKVTTPDPYTNNEIMEKNARKNTEQLAKGSKSKKNGKKDANTKRHNLIGMDGVDSIASSIYKRKKDGSLDQILGEFALDKSTNCGDIVDVGDGMEYQVQKARCQYKYVGGKKFVMTRKILEVKEVRRMLVEREVKQLFDNDGSQSDGDEGVLNLE
jgi:hypothetical protein